MLGACAEKHESVSKGLPQVNEASTAVEPVVEASGDTGGATNDAAWPHARAYDDGAMIRERPRHPALAAVLVALAVAVAALAARSAA